MEMTLFRSKNVFFIAHRPYPFFLLKKHQIVIKLTITLSAMHLESFRICWLKSEKSEVSAHLNYLHANFKDIQFCYQPFLKTKTK